MANNEKSKCAIAIDAMGGDFAPTNAVVGAIEALQEKKDFDLFLVGKKDELLWLIEHNPVYTAGTSSKNKDLLDKNLNVIKTSRGGKHTYHGPGQKVVYFVLNLNKREKDIRKLVSKIEKCIMDILEEYKIKSYTDKKNIGIWVGDKNNPKEISFFNK